MKLHQPHFSLVIPDGTPEREALARTTHLGIGAHQDDLEFMALHGILACYMQADQWFGGITCTDGSGSAHTGAYADFTDAQLMAARREEQILAARIGGYSFIAQLDYPSSAVKSATDRSLVNDLAALLTATRPEVVYTHNPADKHDTHIGVVVAALDAIRSLPVEQRPRQLLGCEVWRDLDWLNDADKTVLDVSGHENLAAALNGVFDSQIAGGKRYDLAVMGRRRAHATFYDSHSTDAMEQAWLALDLSPLIGDEQADLLDFTLSHIDRFKADVEQKLKKRLGR